MTLPNKVTVNEENPHIEVNVSYLELTVSADLYELDGYNLSLKGTSRTELALNILFEYDGYSSQKSINVY